MQISLSHEDTVMLWNDVVEMAHDLPDASILPWLERVAPISLESGTLTLSTRQNWTARKLAGEYRPVIEGLLHDITLEHITLDVAVLSAASTAVPAPCPEQAGSTAQPAAITPDVPRETFGPAPAIERPTTGQPSGGDISQDHAPAAWAVHTAPDIAPDTPPARLSPAALAGAAVAASRAARGADARTAPVAEPPTLMAESVKAPLHAAIPAAGTPTGPQAPSQQHPEPEQPGIESIMPILEDGPLAKSPTSVGYSDFNFDTYIVGESNKLAFSMARAVAEQPGSVANINPLFIWGQSGYGKTHLLLSILNYLRDHQPGMNAQYVAANAFVDQYVDDIRNRGLKGKKVLELYRSVDVLLVDDVQFFERTQESVSTFFDIFNQLIFEGKQIVLAADTPPDYLRLDDRMRTRFSTGAVVDITAPTYEMKHSILRSYYDRCRMRMDWCDVEIPSDTFDIIADLAPNNPRNMQGLMTSIMIKASNDPSVLAPGSIKETVRELFKKDEKITIPAITRKVCEAYGVTADDIKGKSRTKIISEARQVTMWLARQLTDESYESIGGELGGRDHSTVYYGISTIEKRSLEDRGYLYRLESLKKEIVG